MPCLRKRIKTLSVSLYRTQVITLFLCFTACNSYEREPITAIIENGGIELINGKKRFKWTGHEELVYTMINIENPSFKSLEYQIVSLELSDGLDNYKNNHLFWPAFDTIQRQFKDNLKLKATFQNIKVIMIIKSVLKNS
jgi:hypothetical protein